VISKTNGVITSSKPNPKQRTLAQAFIISKRKIIKETIFEVTVILSPNRRCQRKQKYNNAEIISVGIPIVTLDKIASLGSQGICAIKRQVLDTPLS
jgi:hypothetical protein